ncbi:MAG: RNase adapter RapZ [Alphaproteobacteria bacterium]|nr:RNase adapter RapZ [Alphaproteobacteria bacterium]
MPQNLPKLLIVTGLSGAGMSSALKALEDFGFEAFDNFPLFLLESLMKRTAADAGPVAVAIDVRSRDFDAQQLLQQTRALGGQILFIAAEDSILERRFTETRRRHPLAQNKTVSYGIAQEKSLLAPIREEADLVIDTSELSVHDLRHVLRGHYKPAHTQDMAISLLSFAYRRGVPRQADLVFDVRFLRNPHWDAVLRLLSGHDADVGRYIESDPDYATFFKALTDLLRIVLPRYAREGKNYLTIAVGCSGGRHRSVYIVEQLQKFIESLGFASTAEHRDLV